MGTLAGKTLFITGASRGIGLAIALRAAQDGANVTIAAKTTEPHPKLSGTIHTAAEAIEQSGGQALACVVDTPASDIDGDTFGVIFVGGAELPSPQLAASSVVLTYESIGLAYWGLTLK